MGDVEKGELPPHLILGQCEGPVLSWSQGHVRRQTGERDLQHERRLCREAGFPGQTRDTFRGPQGARALDHGNRHVGPDSQHYGRLRGRVAPQRLEDRAIIEPAGMVHRLCPSLRQWRLFVHRRHRSRTGPPPSRGRPFKGRT